MAKTRAQKIKEIHKEALRERLQGIRYIEELDKDGARLDAMYTSRRRSRSEEAIAAINDSLPIVRARIDLNLKRLRFVLPELKSVEMTDPNGASPFADLADALKRATGLQHLTGELGDESGDQAEDESRTAH